MMSHTAHFLHFFVSKCLPIKLEIARSEMYHYRIYVRKGAKLEGVGDLSATSGRLWGNKECMRSCFPPLNVVSMSLGPNVACRLSEVVDLAWPSCIISLLNHVGWVSQWLAFFFCFYLFLFCLSVQITVKNSLNVTNYLIIVKIQNNSDDWCWYLKYLLNYIYVFLAFRNVFKCI